MRGFALVTAILLGAFPAAAQIEPYVSPGIFPTNTDPVNGGGIYPTLTSADTNYSEVAGLVAISARRHFSYEDDLLSNIDPSVTLIYTIDGKPVSGRLTSPYAFTWDSTTVPDGAHVASVILVDGSGDTTKDVPTAVTFLVGNNPTPNTGPQLLPSVGSGVIRNWGRTDIPEWRFWTTGYTWPHPATTTSYTSPVSAPASSRNLSDQGLGPYFTEESLTQSNVTLEQTGLQIARTKAGRLLFETMDPEAGADSDIALPGVLMRPAIDGSRDDNIVSPYSTYVPNPTARGFVGIDLAGRIFQLNMDGSVVTIAGRQTIKSVVPYSIWDSNVTQSDRDALQFTTIGNFNGVGFNEPTDLAFDPRNSSILYVADQSNARIAKVDFSVSPPNITTYAGVPGIQGNVDGPALTAQFGGPNSIVVRSDGTMYVADYDNNSIRMISPDGSTVSTIAGAAQGLSQPFAVRFDSHTNLIIDELTAGNIKHMDLTTNAVTLIASGLCGAGWTWIDVDRNGNIGPIDDVFVNCDTGGDNRTMTRISADGTRSEPSSNYGIDPGHYPWALAIDKNEARLLVHGFGDSAPKFYRFGVPSDIPWSGNYLNTDVWPIQNRLGAYWDNWGTIPEFPFSARSAQAALRGSGYSTIPGVVQFDAMVTLPLNQISNFVRNGLGGSVARPEVTGRDLQLATERVQEESVYFPTQLLPHLPPPPTDTTPPVISNVTLSLIDGTDARVNWTTDKPSLGYVRFGSSTAYFRYSDIENLFGTAHSAVMAHLPVNTLEHFAIVAEDVDSNLTMTPDHTVQTNSLGADTVTTLNEIITAGGSYDFNNYQSGTFDMRQATGAVRLKLEPSASSGTPQENNSLVYGCFQGSTIVFKPMLAPNSDGSKTSFTYWDASQDSGQGFEYTGKTIIELTGKGTITINQLSGGLNVPLSGAQAIFDANPTMFRDFAVAQAGGTTIGKGDGIHAPLSIEVLMNALTLISFNAITPDPGTFKLTVDVPQGSGWVIRDVNFAGASFAFITASANDGPGVLVFGYSAAQLTALMTVETIQNQTYLVFQQ
jgi:hypothetical protein